MRRACLCLLLLVAGTMGVGAQSADDDRLITITFQGMDLDRVLKAVSDELQVRFLYDDKILGRKVNLVSPVDIPRSELLTVLLSVLEIHGFTLVESGGEASRVWKVVPFTSPICNPANKGRVEIYSSDDLSRIPAGDGLVTLMIALKHIDARSAFIAIQGMASDPRMVQAVESANAVAVTDTAENARRIGNMVRTMDQPRTGAVMDVIELKHADPADIVSRLTPLLQTLTVDASPRPPGPPDLGAVASPRPFLVADPRTRQIIIRATKDQIDQLRTLVQEKLDRAPAPPAALDPANLGEVATCKLEELEQRTDGNEVLTLVVPLQHADARGVFIAVQGMASDPRLVQAVEDTATVVVTDRVASLRRIASVLRTIDAARRRTTEAIAVQTVLLTVDPSILASLGGADPLAADPETLCSALLSQPREGVRTLLHWSGRVQEGCEAATEDSASIEPGTDKEGASARGVRQSLVVGLLPSRGTVSLDVKLRVTYGQQGERVMEQSTTLAGPEGKWLMWGATSHVGAGGLVHLFFAKVARWQ